MAPPYSALNEACYNFSPSVGVAVPVVSLGVDSLEVCLHELHGGSNPTSALVPLRFGLSVPAVPPFTVDP